ncbi:cytochrome C oxidase subunit IV family protein [Leadbetterella byssophila]|uniref:cytochrome C oxidase subunit IV family protein n=1 Tax=Leadbetterella byssophila TaxID=316068 RepID=UPI00399F775F
MAAQVERQKPNTKHLWKVFWILLGLTALEFLVAFQVDADHYKWTKIWIFVIMTIVKAYYIVGIFMHLKSETKAFIWYMVLPIMFVIWLIIALLIEGDYFGKERLF